MRQIGPSNNTGSFAGLKRTLRRPAYYWGLRMGLLAVIIGLGFAVVMLVPWAVYYEEKLGQFEDYLAREHDMKLQKILVAGRRGLDQDEILDLMGVIENEPMLRLDLHAIRDRLLTHPVIREVSVRYVEPDTLLVTLEERLPMGVWIDGGLPKLFSHDGHELGVMEVDHEDLPRFAGPGAPEAASELMNMLLDYPEIGKRLSLAIRIGHRRWNLRLDSGLEILLPEARMAEALARITSMQEEEAILDRDLSSIDARLDDRWFLKLSPRIREQLSQKERA
jgi:Cell division septal protein